MATVICGDCSLHVGGKCRILGTTTGDLAACTLSRLQALDLLKQSRALSAASATNREIEVTELVRCSGGEHITITYTVDGGAERMREYTAREMSEASAGTAEENVIRSIRDLVTTVGAETETEIKLVVEGAKFWLPDGSE